MLKKIKNEYRADFDILVDSFVEDIDIRTILNQRSYIFTQ